MDRSRIAEFLLSCALPAERAAAVTGDFLEEAEARGGFWFWSTVIRTVAARIAGDFVRRPLALFGIGVGGCLLGIAPVIVLALLSAPFARYGHRWIVEGLAGLGILVWQVRCGMLLARWNPRSAMASCIAVVLVGWFCIWIVHTTPPRSMANYVSSGARDLLLISGALWGRYRAEAPPHVRIRFSRNGVKFHESTQERGSGPGQDIRR